MAKLLLELQNIRKSFGEKTVLQVDALRVYEGEKIALIGENGAGKSTLLAIMSGEVELDAGYVRRSGSVALIRQSGDARGIGNQQMASQLRAPEQRQGLSGGSECASRPAAGGRADDGSGFKRCGAFARAVVRPPRSVDSGLA